MWQGDTCMEFDASSLFLHAPSNFVVFIGTHNGGASKTENLSIVRFVVIQSFYSFISFDFFLIGVVQLIAVFFFCLSVGSNFDTN